MTTLTANMQIDSGPRLLLVCRAAIEAAASLGVNYFSAVGGLTPGADPLAVGIAIVTDCQWFSVRKEPKHHGLQQQIEGCRLRPGTRVLLVDDVVTTGGSLLKVYEHVIATGASVVGVVALIDRGEFGRQLFAEYDVPYAALVTYRDLRIEPARGSEFAASAN